MRSRRGDIAPRARPRRRVDPGGGVLVVTAVVGALLVLARPVAAIGPLPDPSLPVTLASVPLPTLPVATPRPLPVPTVRLPTPPPLPLPTITPPTLPPVPSVPVPTPTMALPTPTLPVPTPTLIVPTPTLSIAPSLPIGATPPPAPSASPSTGIAGASPGPSSLPSDAAGAGILIGASSAPVEPSSGPADIDPPIVGSSGSLLDSLVVPGLVLGIPAIVIIGIVAAQLAVGAAWLPVIRRWLHRRV